MDEDRVGPHLGSQATVMAWLQELGEAAPLSPRAEEVLRILTASPAFASEASAASVAERCGADAATVVRLAQSLGYSGWSALRSDIRAHRIACMESSDLLNYHSLEDSRRTAAEEAITADIEALQNLLYALPASTVDAMADVMVSAPMTALYGSGSYVGPLTQIHQVAARLGMRTQIVGDGMRSSAADLALLTDADAILVLNLWRTPRDVERVVEVAHAAQARILLITDTYRSRLADMAEVTAVIPAEGISHFPSLAPCLSYIHALLATVTQKLEGTVNQSTSHFESVYKRYHSGWS